MATDYKIAVVPDTGMHPVPSVSGTTTTTACMCKLILSLKKMS